MVTAHEYILKTYPFYLLGINNKTKGLLLDASEKKIKATGKYQKSFKS